MKRCLKFWIERNAIHDHSSTQFHQDSPLKKLKIISITFNKVVNSLQHFLSVHAVTLYCSLNDKIDGKLFILIVLQGNRDATKNMAWKSNWNASVHYFHSRFAEDFFITAVWLDFVMAVDAYLVGVCFYLECNVANKVCGNVLPRANIILLYYARFSPFVRLTELLFIIVMLTRFVEDIITRECFY